MACCKCCCGNKNCAEGEQGKCCCGSGPEAVCCSDGQYCCDGDCQSDPCCCPCGDIDLTGMTVQWDGKTFVVGEDDAQSEECPPSPVTSSTGRDPKGWSVTLVNPNTVECYYRSCEGEGPGAYYFYVEKTKYLTLQCSGSCWEISASTNCQYRDENNTLIQKTTTWIGKIEADEDCYPDGSPKNMVVVSTEGDGTCGTPQPSFSISWGAP